MKAFRVSYFFMMFARSFFFLFRHLQITIYIPDSMLFSQTKSFYKCKFPPLQLCIYAEN